MTEDTCKYSDEVGEHKLLVENSSQENTPHGSIPIVDPATLSKHLSQNYAPLSVGKEKQHYYAHLKLPR